MGWPWPEQAAGPCAPGSWAHPPSLQGGRVHTAGSQGRGLCPSKAVVTHPVLETDFRMLVTSAVTQDREASLTAVLTFIISALEGVSPGTGPRSGHAQHRAQKTCSPAPSPWPCDSCTDCSWARGPAQGRAAAVTMTTH